jgi:hypothetical protein
MRRCLTAALSALALGACNVIDSVLESDPVVKINVGVNGGPITIPRGGTKTVTVWGTAVGQLTNVNVSLTAEKIPSGITVTIDSVQNDGKTSTGRMRITVAPEAALGIQEMRLYGRAAKATEGGLIVRVTVVPPPEIALAVAKPAITVARGGAGPVRAFIARTSFSDPVKFALEGAPAGITTTFPEAGVTNDTANALIQVAASVAPGSYPMTLRASGIGVADQTTPVSVEVTADAIQLIVDSGFVTPQAQSASSDFVVNRGPGVGEVALSAEGFPPGAVVTFNTTPTTNPTARMTVATNGTVPAGDYVGTIRAQAAGFADGVASVPYKVLDASVAIAATPTAIEVLQGQNASITVNLTRTRFTGVVSYSATSLPTGLSFIAQPASTIGTTGSIVFQATPSAPAGTYNVNVNATPSGLGASKVATAVVAVTIRAVPTGTNVVLDWTGCAVAPWIAAQNGAGGWTRVFPVGNTAGLLVNAGRGGYAWYDGTSVNVRFALQSELTAKPINMCPPPDNIGTKLVTGHGVHTLAGENSTYLLGGGTGTSTGAASAFTISGVRDGTHDLVAIGNTAIGARALMRRDLDPPANSALDPVDLTSPESFSVQTRNITINIGLVAGEALNYAYNYLTTASCTENRLASGASSTVQPFNGFPDAVQRADDFHEFQVLAISPIATRSMSVAFRTANNRTMVVPANPTGPNVTSLSHPTMTRLQATFTSLPNPYNSAVTLNYRYNSQSVTVTATNAYTGFVGIVVTTPDLTGISGFQPEWAIPAGVPVLWRLTAAGASVAGPRCTDGRSTVQYLRTGSF